MAYSGNKIPIQLGEIGLLTDIAPDKMPINALIRANNIVFTKGCVEKAPGTVVWNAEALPAGLVAIHQWKPTLEKERMIAVTETGFIYKGRDRKFNTTAPLRSDLGVLNANAQFAEGGAEQAGRPKKLFLCTAGAKQIQVLSDDGDIMVDITKPATDWTSGNYPKCMTVHRNQLWAFAGQISYASNSGDHEDFQTTEAILVEPVYPGEGTDIRGCFVFKGRLFCFKDGGFVYMLVDTDPDEGNWYWQKIASNFGLSAPNAIVEVLDDMYAGNTSGTLTSYSATQMLGNIEAADLIQQSNFESFLRANTSKNGVAFQHIFYYAEKKQLFMTYRTGHFNYNNMLLMLDFSRTDLVRPALWIKGTPQCLAGYLDVNTITRPMYGDKSGFIHLMDRETRIEGDSAYSGEFQIGHLDFSQADGKLKSAEKHFDFLAVHYIPESSGSLSCDYFIDGKFMDTITFTMIQNQRPELDVLTLNKDRLAQPTAETCVRKIYGTGRTFSARFYNNGSNESFQVPAITVYFRAGGDKAQQE